MKKSLASTVLLAAMLPLAALAQPQQGTQEVTLGGGGTSDKDFDSTVVSLNGSWGQYLDSNQLWGVRQTVNINDVEGESTQFNGATRFFYDYHFGSGNTRPFIGLSIGGVYGDGVDDTFMGGPELGIKHYVQDNVFITAMVEYQFLFKSASDAEDNFDDGALFYNIGLGYNF